MIEWSSIVIDCTAFSNELFLVSDFSLLIDKKTDQAQNLPSDQDFNIGNKHYINLSAEAIVLSV
jgi:hypothetical protein